ncbi:MAG: hypothetical protein AB7V27_16685 [Candidatus Binatia bacterium]
MVVVAYLATGAAAARGDQLTTPTEGVEVRIDTVLASNSGTAFDSALSRLKGPFVSLFPYSSYRLIQGERRVVAWRREEQFMLPGGRYLVIMPRGVQGDRVSLNVMLIHGTRPLVSTVLSLKNRGTFLVGGPPHGEGVLIIAIGAATAPQPTPGLALQTGTAPP